MSPEVFVLAVSCFSLQRLCTRLTLLSSTMCFHSQFNILLITDVILFIVDFY